MLDLGRIHGLLRKTFCYCKYCENVFRLSDAEINSVSKTSPDWLSKINNTIYSLEEKLSKAELAYSGKRELLVAKERQAAESMSTKQLKKIIPHFSKVKFNSRDIKTIGFPIKFISFDGKDSGSIKKIRFLDFIPHSVNHEKILNSLSKTISLGRYLWVTLRINDHGQIEED